MEEVIKDLGSVLLVFVLPIWLFLHYRLKINQVKYGLPDEEVRRLKDLQATATRLQERVESLESILDDCAPEWRKMP